MDDDLRKIIENLLYVSQSVLSGRSREVEWLKATRGVSVRQLGWAKISCLVFKTNFLKTKLVIIL